MQEGRLPSCCLTIANLSIAAASIGSRRKSIITILTRPLRRKVSTSNVSLDTLYITDTSNRKKIAAM